LISPSGREVVVNEQVTISIVTIMFFSMVGYIAMLLTSSIRRSKIAKYQAEMQTKLLEKFGSSQELLAYMQTEAGQRFAQPIEPAAPTEAKSPHSKILGSIKVGTILTFLGFGLLLLAITLADEEPFYFFGTISLAIGLGFLVSSGISYKLSKSWGLFESETSEASRND
jgi:hypothetical protein